MINKRNLISSFTEKKTGADISGISRMFGVPESDIYMPVQRHTDHVHVLRFDMDRKVSDAVLTRRANVLLGVVVADCVPILLHDPVRMVCGAVHAGWRGTASGILKKTISVMVKEFYSNPSDILMAIGPSIRWCCYHVGREVLDAVKLTTGDGEYQMSRGSTLCLDLPSANRVQALSKGLSEKNILMSDECTYCNPHKYYSYRYAKGPTGRQGGFIGMFDQR
jgi:YfiH family protein